MNKKNNELHFYFVEKMISNHEFAVGGFCEEVIINNLTLNGQIAFLHITRIRWTTTNNVSHKKELREALRKLLICEIE